MVYQQQPGDALLTGQISGQQLGQALFEFGPSLPTEGPPFLPRFMARRLFPKGFLVQQPQLPPVGMPVQPAPAQPPAQVIPPGQPAIVQQPRNQVRQSVANQIPQQPAYGYRSVQSGAEPIMTRSQRLTIRERPGL